MRCVFRPTELGYATSLIDQRPERTELAVIEVIHLHKTYGAIVAVYDVSFAVEEG